MNLLCEKLKLEIENKLVDEYFKTKKEEEEEGIEEGEEKKKEGGDVPSAK